MAINIIYLVTFLLTLIVMLYTIINNDKYNTSEVIMMIVIAVGNGGFYAMATSKCLEEAILANKVTYVIGMFAPISLFFIVCEICKFKIKKCIRATLIFIQIILFLFVCTIGKYPFYYKTVEFHQINGFSYITKTYGPIHIFYVLSMMLYFLAVIVVAAGARKHKSRVSSRNIDSIIILEFLTITCYLMERVVNLNFELLPLVNTIMITYLLYPLSKIRLYSIFGNTDLINKKLNSTGYIVLDKKLHYMSCNEQASDIFPELLEWELEKKIPGSGGGFNTFLRLPLMGYVESGSMVEENGKSFTLKGKNYRIVMNVIVSQSKKLRGYIIELFAEEKE